MLTTKSGSPVFVIAQAPDWKSNGKVKKQVEVGMECKTGYYENTVLVDDLVGDVGQGELFEGEG